MIVNPSVDQILEGVMMSLEDDIAPAVTNPKASATIQMIQSLLQGVRQMLPVLEAQLVEEHNDMIRTLQESAAALGDASGPAAERVRERAATYGSWDELPSPLDRDGVIAAHTELGRAIEASFYDLDELLRDGVESANGALDVVRGHIGPRCVRDADVITVGDGFVGRG